MKEDLLNSGKRLMSDIAQVIKSELESLDEKSQERLDEIMETNPPVGEKKVGSLIELDKAKPARFQLKDIVLPATTENEIREALIKVKFHELI